MVSGKYIGQGIAKQFEAMISAAKTEGVVRNIEFGMRTTEQQQKLWD
jgi:hypothetical protein